MKTAGGWADAGAGDACPMAASRGRLRRSVVCAQVSINPAPDATPFHLFVLSDNAKDKEVLLDLCGSMPYLFI